MSASDLEAIESLPTLNAAAHDAASLDDRSIGTWTPLPASADADLSGELPVMVGRSRDLVRNNGIAAGGLQTLKDNIIAAAGSGHRLGARMVADGRGGIPQLGRHRGV